MNDFDRPAVKAESDAEILDALQGVKMVQSTIRAAVEDGKAGAGVALAFFRAYYDKLPGDVARRLTEITPETVERITAATGQGLSGEGLKGFAARITGDAAFAQVIRAANVYRARLGYSLLGPDGWPEEGGGADGR